MNGQGVIDRSGCPKRYGVHGTASSTERGCSCPDAIEAMRIYRKRRRQGRQLPGYVPAIGTARRLKALAADGWPAVELARRLGVTQQMVSYLRNPPGRLVRRDNAERVAALFDQLEGHPGPSEWTRSRAVIAGWHTSMAWLYLDIDDHKVRPSSGQNRAGPLSGEPSSTDYDDVIDGRTHLYTLPPRYRRVVADRMLQWGLTPRTIAKRLSIQGRVVEERTIERYKTQLRAARVAEALKATADEDDLKATG